MKRRESQLALAFVAMLFGFLCIVQLRAQSTGSGLQNLSSQDLTTLIANLNQRNGQLSTEVQSLQGQLRTLQAAQARGQSSVGGLRIELQRLRLWAGLDAATGRGVIVQCTGPVGADAVNDLLNDLRTAGAEALAVEQVRVVEGTVVGGDPGQLSVEDAPLPSPFTIIAIGNPVNLTAALTRVGGVIGRIQVADPAVQISVTPSDQVTVPATDRDLRPADAQPHV